MTEAEFHVSRTALRQHLQELSSGCLSAPLQAKLGFSSGSVWVDSLLKMSGAAALSRESLLWCQTGCYKQTRVLRGKKGCSVHSVAIPLSVCCSTLHISLALFMLGLSICNGQSAGECCPLPCGGFLEGAVCGDPSPHPPGCSWAVGWQLHWGKELFICLNMQCKWEDWL